MRDFMELLEGRGVCRCVLWTDPPTGLRAVLVLDDLRLGPAAGGIRTRAYPSIEDALADAARLAQAMTVKCALAGLEAGGGKAVVLDHPGLDRPRAFAELGRRVEELGGLFRTAGDLGTRASDLAAMAAHTGYVHTDEGPLADAVARGVMRCAEACAEVACGDAPGRGSPGSRLEGLRVAVQGCGSIGAAVARAFRAQGATLVVADVDPARAEAVARDTGATITDPSSVLEADVDLLAPCAIGQVLTEEVVTRVRAWAICGAANNLLATPAAGRRLAERGILFVPDELSSAGAVIQGIGRTVMHLPDPGPLIDRLGATARTILTRARAEALPPTEVAHTLAHERLTSPTPPSPTRG